MMCSTFFHPTCVFNLNPNQIHIILHTQPSKNPTLVPVTDQPTSSPNKAPVTEQPTTSPSKAPITNQPSSSPTKAPVTEIPSTSPVKPPVITPSPTEPPVSGHCTSSCSTCSAYTHKELLAAGNTNWYTTDANCQACANGYPYWPCNINICKCGN